MSSEELAVKIRAGESDLLPVLWEQVERFVRMQAFRAAGAMGDYGKQMEEDLYQSGYIALAAAVNTFNEENGAFLTWYGLYLKTAFAEASDYRTKLQRYDPIRNAYSLDAPTPGTEDQTLSDTVADPIDQMAEAEEAIYCQELHAAMLEALAALPDDLREVIRQRFYLGRTREKAAEDMGSTSADVYNLEGKAIRQMRQEKIVKKLRPFVYADADIYAAGLRGSSVRSFEASHSSSTEYAALRMVSGQRI